MNNTCGVQAFGVPRPLEEQQFKSISETIIFIKKTLSTIHFDVFFSIESLFVMAGLLQQGLTEASVCSGQADAVQPCTFAFLPPYNLVSLPW